MAVAGSAGTPSAAKRCSGCKVYESDILANAPQVYSALPKKIKMPARV